MKPTYVLTNGQVWIRTESDGRERYQRLVRAPNSDKNFATIEKLQDQGMKVLDVVEEVE